MAIARDASSQGGATGASPKTWSHTCAAGASLLVFIYTNSATDDVSNVTYNGVACTRITGVNSSAIYSMSVWFLANPSSGANNISAQSGSSLSGFGASYTGVAGGVDSSNQGVDTTPAIITMSLTTTADNCWQVSMCANDGSNPTASTGFNTLQGPTGAAILGDSNGALTPAGAKSMDCTTSSGANATWVTVALSPTASGGGGATRDARALSLLGVG